MKRKREGNLLGVPEEWEREVWMHMIKAHCLLVLFTYDQTVKE